MAVDADHFRMNTAMHAAFQRELQRLSRAVPDLDLSDPAAIAGLQRRFRFFADTLQTHHMGEDEFLWPVALEQATGEEKAVLRSMAAEHDALAAALERARSGVEVLSPDSDVAVIQSHLDDLAKVLTGHCAHEERDAVPVVAKYVSPEDFTKLMEHARSAEDSDLVLAWVCDGAPQEVVDATWGMLPGFVRMMVKPMTTRKYNKFTAECGI